MSKSWLLLLCGLLMLSDGALASSFTRFSGPTVTTLSRKPLPTRWIERVIRQPRRSR